jgi:hypothetical protein
MEEGFGGKEGLERVMGKEEEEEEKGRIRPRKALRPLTPPPLPHKLLALHATQQTFTDTRSI